MLALRSGDGETVPTAFGESIATDCATFLDRASGREGRNRCHFANCRLTGEDASRTSFSLHAF